MHIMDPCWCREWRLCDPDWHPDGVVLVLMDEATLSVRSFLALRLNLLMEVDVVAALLGAGAIVDLRLRGGASVDGAYHALEPVVLGRLTAQPAASAS